MKNKTTPPKWSTKFLEAICPDDLFEEIEGDLIQRFNKDRRKFTDSQAKIRFVWNVLRFFRPGILLRNKVSTSIMPLYMLASYFKIAFRVMLRNKAFSVINISGLVLGITSAILLFLWISHEFSYDQFHQDKNRIFKAYNKSIFDGEVVCWDYTPRILAPTLSEEYSSVESAISFAHYTAEYLFSTGQNALLKMPAYLLTRNF